MAHSYAERPTLICPTCGQSLTPDLWLIIDIVERPDLLARVREGTIHHVACPNGHAGFIDAPLLIYRPGEPRPLMLATAEKTSHEENERAVNELMNRLADSLGDMWRDEWLESSALVPRHLLGAALSDDPAVVAGALREATPPTVRAAMREIAAVLTDEGIVLESPDHLERLLAERPELRARLEMALAAAAGGQGEAADDPLLGTLYAFLQADSWLDSFRLASEHPELLSDAADEALMKLVEGAMAEQADDAARALMEHLALLRRARTAGVAAAFAEKLGTTPEELAAALESERASPAATLPVHRAIDEVIAALAAEGVDTGSREAVEAALAARPELAARLDEMVRQDVENALHASQTARQSPPDDLLNALQVFVQAETWFASYQYVTDHPELLTDAADATLARLVAQATEAGKQAVAQHLAEHLTLLQRARAAGATVAFAEKLGTTPEKLAAAREAMQAS